MKRTALAFALAGAVVFWSGPAALASIPICNVFEDGSGSCYMGSGKTVLYGNDPNTDQPCYVLKSQTTTGRPAVSSASGPWPNHDLRLYQSRSLRWLCIVVTT